ncbi:MAG: GNAT family N-acetyltransferase [Bdellovibrionaceae bacterium]|nr:GNAT family N-acetyltransferase [Pseudobdellovibrionaceae bacterium]
MFQIREFTEKDIPAVRAFTDAVIGKNYFSEAELLENLQKSQAKTDNGNVVTSFVLVDGNKIMGLRLAYAPGLWSKGKGKKLRPDLWRTPHAETAYFQSLFLSLEAQGQGWGPKLSAASIESFRKLGATAIVTHAWKESPNNSSIRYLSKQGFESVAVHPEYWIDVDYECVLDGKPCRCTAEEMILYI